MGNVEEKIKTQLFNELFADSYKMYEFIENRFNLTNEEQKVLINIVNEFTNELTIFLKNKKLSWLQ